MTFRDGVDFALLAVPEPRGRRGEGLNLPD